MHTDQDALMLVRADLCGRLDSLRALASRQHARDFDAAVAGIRQIAAAYGLTPVARLAEALEQAGRRDGPVGCPRALYLDRLQDAIGCTRLDDAAGEAMIASVNVRFDG
jgi:hypothetical protein